ncbi:hypothetical protein JCM10213_003834 [Rhodosporidiobolus nylandii]
MLVHLFNFIAGALSLLIFPALLKRVTGRNQHELYEDSDALLLNLEAPRERWFNMGWWLRSGKESFSEAAAEHCRRVAAAAGVESGSRVLEVGYGFGDSTLLLAREFFPSSYVGVTSLQAQHEVAARRAAEAGLDTTQYRLLQGDAARLDRLKLAAESMDSILAVDCAYHFSPRSSFLRASHALLAPGGRLGLSDLLVPPTPLSLFDTLLLRLICALAGLPFSNLHTPAAYRAELVRAGFRESEIEMEDVSDAVWPGFLAFVERRERELGGRGVLGSGWSGMKVYAGLVRWYSGARGGRARFRYFLVSARKGGGNPEE